MKLSHDDFDDMLHALGRPQKPNMDTYRNYYCCDSDGMEAARFEASGCWDFVRHINNGRDAVYSVNGVGKQRLAEYLANPSETA